ncbi:MAG: hypothetical protein GYA23_10100 [Methanomicrobiales archaeon]|nr:hypothetical protein [Methanomicrobiales archaeon]
MTSWENMGLRILAQYVRRKAQATPDPASASYYDQTLRVDGQGIIPRSEPKYCVQITIKDDPQQYRFPVPAEFNKQRYFVIKEDALPVKIPYDADVKISIMETDRKGERVLAQSPLRYRTI